MYCLYVDPTVNFNNNKIGAVKRPYDIIIEMGKF